MQIKRNVNEKNDIVTSNEEIEKITSLMGKKKALFKIKTVQFIMKMNVTLQ
jgi:hypothetical protein